MVIETDTKYLHLRHGFWWFQRRVKKTTSLHQQLFCFSKTI